MRTALCSSRMPEYWTGICQPPKSTILASAGEVGFEERSALEAGGVRHARESKFQGSIGGVFEGFRGVFGGFSGSFRRVSAGMF